MESKYKEYKAFGECGGGAEHLGLARMRLYFRCEDVRIGTQLSVEGFPHLLRVKWLVRCACLSSSGKLDSVATGFTLFRFASEMFCGNRLFAFKSMISSRLGLCC